MQDGYHLNLRPFGRTFWSWWVLTLYLCSFNIYQTRCSKKIDHNTLHSKSHSRYCNHCFLMPCATLQAVCAPKWKRKSRIQNIHTGRTFFCVSLTSNEESDASHSADWIQAVDRGGQCRISESTFMVFYEMECTFHRLLNFQTIEKPSMTSDLRKGFHDSIITDENVLFHWAMVNTKKPARILLGRWSYTLLDVLKCGWIHK